MSFGMITQHKDWRESEIMLHGYRQLYSLHENRRHLRRHCK